MDVLQDKKGEYFSIIAGDGVELSVRLSWDDMAQEWIKANILKDERHLLLNVKLPAERKGISAISHKYLLGHDERHWFSAAVPNSAVTNVKQAMDSLKPVVAKTAQKIAGVRKNKINKRKNAGYTRQGEWFFIPQPNFIPSNEFIYKNEPIRRGRSKPHMCEELIRKGGESVHVCTRYPNGLTEKEYKALISKDATQSKINWRMMVRNANVYVRGKIKHPDHKTILLIGWHSVQMNTESNAPQFETMAFLD